MTTRVLSGLVTVAIAVLLAACGSSSTSRHQASHVANPAPQGSLESTAPALSPSGTSTVTLGPYTIALDSVVVLPADAEPYDPSAPVQHRPGDIRLPAAPVGSRYVAVRISVSSRKADPWRMYWYGRSPVLRIDGRQVTVAREGGTFGSSIRPHTVVLSEIFTVPSDAKSVVVVFTPRVKGAPVTFRLL